jgi:heptaprenyl diphosphate synthase
MNMIDTMKESPKKPENSGKTGTAPYFSAKRIAFVGVFAAAAIILSAADSFLSAVLPPGIRFGLANTAVFAAAAMLGGREAAALTALKCLFVFITRGVFAGLMSLSGSIPALLLLLLLLYKSKRSYVFISATAAVIHALGQITCAAIFTESPYTFWYLPVMIIASVVSGVLTGVIVTRIVDIFQKNKKGT